MPKRTDIKKILVIGSGPIVIGQACEFDYSGTQACKALREEGYEVVLVQLQPGHHHDRPGDRRPHLHRAHHRRLRGEGHRARSAPTPCCPTLGGQTGLNCAVALADARRAGQVRRRGHRLRPSTPSRRARTASCFKRAMERHRPGGAPRPASPTPSRSALAIADELGYPADHPPRPSPWAAPAAALPTTTTSLLRIVRAGPGPVP